MKKLILGLASISFALMSATVFANKIIVTGEPVALEKQGDFYIVPDTFKPTTNYYYVTVEGSKRVCYLEKQPNLASVDLMAINVNVGGTRKSWNCYLYDTTYFTAQP